MVVGFLLCPVKSPFKQKSIFVTQMLTISDVKFKITSKLHLCYELHKYAHMFYEANM